LFFVGTLGPALGFVNVYPMRYSFVADHFQYLACIGLIALVVATGARVLRRRAVRLVLAGGVIVALGIISWQRCAAFHDEETVWRDTLAKNPGCWMAENNLGTVLREQGRTSEAIACFEQALRIKPDSVNAHYNLGKALARQGKLDEGIGHLQEALRLEPGYIDAHIGLADALASAGNVKEAIAHYELVLRAQSGNAIAHYNVARLYATDGNLPEAVAQYREALRLMPDYAHACNNLAWLLATSESSTAPDHAEAIQMATRASELAAGKDPDYLDTLAVAYAAANRFPEAVSTAQKAVELARSSGQPALADEIASRLELYRVGRAYHESVPTTSPQNQRSS